MNSYLLNFWASLWVVQPVLVGRLLVWQYYDVTTAIVDSFHGALRHFY
jgi:hypothetical protein